MLLSAKTASNQLTPRQLQLLRVIAHSQASRCYSPTIAELALELRISRSTVFEHIGELRKKHLLCACPGKARSLKLNSAAQELLSRIAPHQSPDIPGGNPKALLTPVCPIQSHREPEDWCGEPDQAAGHTSIPLLGVVAAGAPIEAVENAEPLSLESYFAIDDNTYALEVRGDSMIDADIRNGDYVVCRRRCAAEDGQLVVAIVDNENATLKRFYREDSRVRLEPANDDYDPIYSSNCRIEAVVVGLVRKL